MANSPHIMLKIYFSVFYRINEFIVFLEVRPEKNKELRVYSVFMRSFFFFKGGLFPEQKERLEEHWVRVIPPTGCQGDLWQGISSNSQTGRHKKIHIKCLNNRSRKFVTIIKGDIYTEPFIHTSTSWILQSEALTKYSCLWFHMKRAKCIK